MITLKDIEEYFQGTNYTIVDGSLYRTVINAKGESVYRISNFIAYIECEEIFDDGADSKRCLIIGGFHCEGYDLPKIKVSSVDFPSCTWVAKSWGAKCNIEPSSNNKEFLRHATQLTAKSSQIKTTFGHLGFRKLNNKWIYIHGNGCIGDKGVSVELNKRLANYCLSKVSFPKNNSFLELLNEKFISHRLSIPLIAIAYLSPLNEFLKMSGNEPKVVLFLSGKTGSKKSTLAALFLSHFGDFTNTDLPLSFRDTENSIVEQTFLLKDTLTVIDDFHPSSRLDEMSMNKTAQTIMRAFGDRVGKNRLRSDSTLIPSKPPRGNALITGESSPDISESGTARYLTLELNINDIDVSLLSDLQDKAKKGYFKSIMYGYIEWLIIYANKNEVLFSDKLSKIFLDFRNSFQEDLNKDGIEVHARIPEAIAWLYLGFYMALQFSNTSKAITDDELEKLKEDCYTTLYNLAISQSKFVFSDKPTDKFIKKLTSLFDSKLIYVVGLHDEPNNTTDGFIGYEDENFYYLILDIAHKKVKRQCEEQGEHFTISAKSLSKQLGEEGFIEVKDNKNTLLKRVGSKNLPQRFIWLKKNRFIEGLE